MKRPRNCSRTKGSTRACEKCGCWVYTNGNLGLRMGMLAKVSDEFWNVRLNYEIGTPDYLRMFVWLMSRSLRNLFPVTNDGYRHSRFCELFISGGARSSTWCCARSTRPARRCLSIGRARRFRSSIRKVGSASPP